MTKPAPTASTFLDRPIIPGIPWLTFERSFFVLILLLAFASRFWDLGARVMSHDESLHTYFSYLYYKGDGYQHNPMMHGPLQFHLIALSYFLFGPSDFSARIPAATFSVATIALMWFWRRYLGSIGALLAAVMMLISPMMLFYGRYAREDSYAVFAGILTLYAVLRYFDTGSHRFVFLLSAALSLHFLDKETSFMYAAELLLFLAATVVADGLRREMQAGRNSRLALVLAFAGLVALIFGALMGNAGRAQSSSQPSVLAPGGGAPPISPISLVIGAALLGISLYLILARLGWNRIRANRSFELIIVIGTLISPTLVPLLLKPFEGPLGFAIPTSQGAVQALSAQQIGIIAAVLGVVFAACVGIGQAFRPDWWKIALIFWLPFVTLYTSLFTNTDGFFTGTLGSLGYWLAQQGVERGSQPWYYYVLIILPIYEFLPLIGAIATGVAFSIMRGRSRPKDGTTTTRDAAHAPYGVYGLLAWWALISIIVFSYAGEKMPWLSYHLAWPLILIAAIGIQKFIRSTDWSLLAQPTRLAVAGAAAIALLALLTAIGAFAGDVKPFQGPALEQLQATARFLLPAAVSACMIYIAWRWRTLWTTRTVFTALALAALVLLAILTGRAAFRAAYVNYDFPTEYLVYAHSGPAVKDVIAQAAEISKRTTGGMTIDIAYDASAPDTGVSWPFVWYLRDFPNQHSFDQPTRALRDNAIIVVDPKNFDKIDAALGGGFTRIDYTRMWWPNQAYFDLVPRADPSTPSSASCVGLFYPLRWIGSYDFSRLCSAIADPSIRAAIWDIWLNRDYSKYAAATGSTSLTLATWQPSDAMRMYIRTDIAQKMWPYGLPAAAASSQVPPDPYAGKVQKIAAALIIPAQSVQPPMVAPRALAFAPDGTFYVTDSGNNRVLHFRADGVYLSAWGTSSGNQPSNPNPNSAPGTFNEPWGIAVGTDGSVYVADTWNYRVQKFDAAGKFLTSWSSWTHQGQPETFYGPRGLAIDGQGNLLVMDTGNKRVVVFDPDGNFLTQFGTPGMDPGSFDEPVGIAVDSGGTVIITDTWNQRIQEFKSGADGSYAPFNQWSVAAWAGQSVGNKPFVAVDKGNRVFVTDPEANRIIAFDITGKIISTWGDYGIDSTSLSMPVGIAVDKVGAIWVADSGNNRIMKFTVP